MPVERRASAHPGGTKPLDPASRQAVRSFLTRASIYAAFAVLPWLLGLRAPTDAGSRLVAFFALGAAIAMVIAAMHGEKPGRGPLNRWDEAMALDGLSLLTHFVLLLSGLP